MAIEKGAELLNPFTGEVVSDPTIDDAFRIYKQINELETNLKKAKALAQAFVDNVIQGDKYECDNEYQFRRVPRRTVEYDVDKLKTFMSAELILTLSKVDPKSMDGYVAEGLKTHELSGDQAGKIMDARTETVATHIRLEKIKFDKKGE